MVAAAGAACAGEVGRGEVEHTAWPAFGAPRSTQAPSPHPHPPPPTPTPSPQFKLDDDHIFTCVGTSGREPLALPSPILQQQAAAAGAGEQPAPEKLDPEAFLSALRNFMANAQPPGGGQQ